MSDREKIAKVYDLVAPWYDSWGWQTFWDKNEAPIVNAEIARISSIGRAVDLGMGTGRYVAMLREMGVDAFGIDVSPEMVRMAVRKLKCKDRFFVGDLCSPALEPESFGLAIAARAFCHVEDIFSAFSAAYRLVRPNGILIVTELDVDHEFERTRIPTPDGKLQVDTWKRSNEELIGVARLAGWNLSRLSRVSAINCAWLPEGKGLASIDRASDRVIFNVLSFCRT